MYEFELMFFLFFHWNERPLAGKWHHYNFAKYLKFYVLQIHVFE